MDRPWDAFAKDILDVLLSEYGTVEREAEAPALPAQRGDVLFVPDPARDAARRELGTVGEMTDAAALIEPFSDAPSIDDGLACLRKALNHGHAATLREKQGARRAWLLCAGRPTAAMEALGARPMTGFPPGFYALAEALPMSFVVLAELPETDDTLALRLLGRESTRRNALETLRTRHARIPHGEALYRVVLETFRRAHTRGAKLEEQLMVDLTETVAWMQQERLEGRIEGKLEGKLEGRIEGRIEGKLEGRIEGKLEGRIEGRLARPLTESEQTALHRRVDELGAQRATDLALALPLDELRAWLAPPTA